MSKYFWLKLRHDFFNRHDSKIIESQENGEKYLLFYLKLMAQSVKHEGRLRFSEMIPYDLEMLATITNTDIDVVRSAMKLLSELQLVQVLDDDTVYLQEVQNMIGSETDWAAKKRAQREKDIVLKVSGHSPIELETELETDKKKSTTRYDNLCKKYGKAAVDDMLETVDNYCASKGKRYKDKVATAANWLKRDGVATLPGYGIKATPKLPLCAACGGKRRRGEYDK